MKHRPSWNHLDLKQMHWLFSQQAFLLGAETGCRVRVARKGFQPPALAAIACDRINTRVSSTGSSGKIMKMRWVTALPYRICSFSHLESHLPQTEMENQQDSDQNGKASRHHMCQKPSHYVILHISLVRKGLVGWQIRGNILINEKANTSTFHGAWSTAGAQEFGSQDFHWIFVTINTTILFLFYFFDPDKYHSCE